MVQINHLAFLLEALPYNIGVTTMVCLLSSYYSKGNMSLGAFGCLEMVAIIPFGLVLQLLGCFIMSFLGSAGCILVSKYTIRV